ncbi:outer membrane beta-barrel protein [Pontibacter sp. KCTC 32443]|uniref:outer membrane beta-barrel protein n=1 Tax=Pontibacter TaxID=323449 RepID=UPI00164E0AA6|nr:MULTISPECIES: outer membrane beta-barrel protein [Pontibacter]MBC5773804.1 outer membrane beta-barrel protein [Pontibacter sp. KCTC 32443]
MKRLILLACTAFIIVQASAQDQSKSFYATVGIGASVKKGDGNTTKTFEVSPAINYLLNERWSIGLFVEHSRAVSKSESVQVGTGTGSYSREIKSSQQSWYLGPQVRYFYPVHNKLFIFAEAQAGYIHATSDASNGYLWVGVGGNRQRNTGVSSGQSDIESYTTALQAYVSPGLMYFIKPRFGLELKMNALQYNHGLKDSRLPGGETEDREFEADLCLEGSTIGASFYF